MAVYAEHHRGQDGTAIVCPVCVEKVWYANTAYGYMKLTDYIEAHREHTRPPRLELPETAVTVRQGEPVKAVRDYIGDRLEGIVAKYA